MTAPSFSPEGQQQLLRLARAAITASLQGELFNPMVYNDNDELLLHRGVFVTLNKQGRLRGCIGTVESREPLYKTVAEMALQAAFSDPRFPPLAPYELSLVRIEISILSPLEPVKDHSSIRMGEHGIMIQAHGRRGLFLPQVADQTGWSTEKFLDMICVEKMGLPANTWRDPEAEIHRFTVEIVEEMEVR